MQCMTPKHLYAACGQNLGAGSCDDAPPLLSFLLSCSLPLRIAFTYSLSLSTLYPISPSISSSRS